MIHHKRKKINWAQVTNELHLISRQLIVAWNIIITQQVTTDNPSFWKKDLLIFPYLWSLIEIYWILPICIELTYFALLWKMFCICQLNKYMCYYISLK